MKAIDTNVLVRFFTQDDPEQSPRAEAILASFSASNPVWVGLAVVLELVWVLEDSYGMKRDALVAILNQVLTRQELVVERAETVRQALHLYHNGNVDFADCLISRCASAAGCEEILTFDRRAACDAGMQLIA
jgi:predicted nucleic-acid-binding protein